MKCPCKSCEKAGCGSFHDECERYAEWKKYREGVIARRAADADVRNIIISARIRLRGQKK